MHALSDTRLLCTQISACMCIIYVSCNFCIGSGLILDKVDVCGETSLLVTNKAVRFDWKDYGLTLDIPSEVLPIDVGQCILSINASNSGDYEFPNGYHLISPVFWIRCEPNCTFKKPISMGIQHCARSKNKPSLRLVRASCTQEKLPYSFELIKPTEGKSFDANSIQLSKFSGYAIVQEGSEDLSYTSKLFYFAKDVHNCKVHFTVSKDIPSHRTVSWARKLKSVCYRYNNFIIGIIYVTGNQQLLRE